MNEWFKRTSTARVIAGTAFVVAALAFMIYYFSFSSFPKTNRLSVWFGGITTASLFLIAFYIGFGIRTRKVVAGALVLTVWSLGLVVIPIPEGYGETVLGGWAILLMLILAAYAKYEKSQKKKTHLVEGVTERG